MVADQPARLLERWNESGNQKAGSKTGSILFSRPVRGVTERIRSSTLFFLESSFARKFLFQSVGPQAILRLL